MTAIFASDMRAELIRQVSEAGSASKWARNHGISQTSLSLQMTGRRPVSEEVANVCGFVVEPSYRRMK